MDDHVEIFTSLITFQNYINTCKQTGLKIGFVPTMGALHEGHLSLIEEAKSVADVVVCSIFVNPTQFNDPKDLEKYPRPIEQDIELLESVHCQALFLPEVNDMYPQEEANHWAIDLGDLDRIWEGKHRPGHFQGVTQIVYKLFQLVQPDVAFFGQKDFQQVMVIQRMIAVKDLPVSLQVVPTLRDQRGLALSSRNVRLSASGKEKAYSISKALRHIKDHANKQDLTTLIQQATAIINEQEGTEIEYLAVCIPETLEPVSTIVEGKKYVALVAVWLEGIRLIDNMLL